MEMCGICGSDVTAYRGVNPTMKYPINGLGHEGVGIIEAIGENDKGLKVGDRVALEPYVPQWYLDNNFNLISVGSNKKFIYNT